LGCGYPDAIKKTIKQ